MAREASLATLEIEGNAMEIYVTHHEIYHSITTAAKEIEVIWIKC